MDRIDEKILEVLVKNANATSTEIGNLVNLSVTAVNKRILRKVSYNRLWKLLIDKGMHKSHKQAIEKSSYIY